MEKKVIKGVLVNTQTNEIKPYSFEYEENKEGKSNFLPRMYGLLNCDCIDIVERKFGEHAHDVICDDEGLLKQEQQLSMLTFYRHNLTEQLVGNLFICSHNEDGETVSLTDKEIKGVLQCIRGININGEMRKVLVARL